jgi:hypothetical protein
MYFEIGKNLAFDGSSLFGNIRLKLRKRSQKKVEGLESFGGRTRKGRLYTKAARAVWGLAEDGKRKDLETDRILTRVFKRIGLRRVSGGYSVN